MKLTLIAQGTYSDEWPELEVFVNGDSCGRQKVEDLAELDFEIRLDRPSNTVEIHYVNKQEHHTKVEDGQVVADQCVELLKIRVDDILCHGWMLTTGVYYPRYFQGFRDSNPDAPSHLRSQLIWHFPGVFQLMALPARDQFWDWYCQQRREVHMRSFQGKSLQRQENYVGSLDPLTDLVDEIKAIIDVQ